MAEIETVPWLAEQIGTLFPELGGRSVPVLWGDITKENAPTLPIALVELGRQTFTSAVGKSRMQVSEAVSVAFWLKPVILKYDNGGVTPFWAYYPVNTYRNRLYSWLSTVSSPSGAMFTMERMDIDATEFAVEITFLLNATYDICREDPVAYDDCGREIATDGFAREISFKICRPASDVCDPPMQQPKEKPCE